MTLAMCDQAGKGSAILAVSSVAAQHKAFFISGAIYTAAFYFGTICVERWLGHAHVLLELSTTRWRRLTRCIEWLDALFAALSSISLVLLALVSL